MAKRDDEKARRDEKRDRDREHARGRGYGLERSGYLEVLARKWRGSEPPTPQAYARAVKQWRQLPGAVVTAPADLGTLPAEPPVSSDKGNGGEL